MRNSLKLLGSNKKKLTFPICANCIHLWWSRERSKWAQVEIPINCMAHARQTEHSPPAPIMFIHSAKNFLLLSLVECQRFDCSSKMETSHASLWALSSIQLANECLPTHGTRQTKKRETKFAYVQTMQPLKCTNWMSRSPPHPRNDPCTVMKTTTTHQQQRQHKNTNTQMANGWVLGGWIEAKRPDARPALEEIHSSIVLGTCRQFIQTRDQWIPDTCVCLCGIVQGICKFICVCVHDAGSLSSLSFAQF